MIQRNEGPLFCSQAANQINQGIAETSEMLVVEANSVFYFLCISPGDRRRPDNRS